MGYPELKSDETIILTAQHVKVKSVPFELVLTNRRLILIDSEKNVVPTQQIPLMTIRNVMTSENAIRDPVITLTILTDTSDTREMALTFAMQTAGERKREAGEWVKTLKKYISEASSYPVEPVMSEQVQDRPHYEAPASPGTKKKIEIARPLKKIAVDTSHMPPKPVETTSLPEGSFCPRCGNRIPPGSTFCNRCGTKIIAAAEPAAAPAAAPEQITTAPAAGTEIPVDLKGGRPIEQIIHSIEPLIDDSVPRKETAPTVPEPEHALYVPPTETPAAPADNAAPATPQVPAAIDAPSSSSGADIPPIPPVPSIPPVPEAPRKKRSSFLVAAIVVVIVIGIAAAGFVFLSGTHKTQNLTPLPATAVPVNTTIVPTTVATIKVTTVPTTAVPTTAASSIPPNGVWVEVSYDQQYTGLIGAPGSQDTYTGTGDHLYRVRVDDGGTVAISLQKTDGSGDELKVAIYKDGVLVKTASTSVPKGKIDLQYLLAVPTTVSTAAIATLATTEAAATTNATAVTTTNGTATNSTA